MGTPLDDVQLYQIVLHFLHRVGAVVVVAFIALLTWLAVRYEKTHPQLLTMAYLLCGTLLAQFVLGMTIVMTQRSPAVASIHVTVGAAALAFASGQAAITAAILTITHAGQNIISATSLYGGTWTLFTQTFKKLGIEVRFFDPAKPEEYIKSFAINKLA